MERKDWKHCTSEQSEICLMLRRKVNTVSWLRLVAFSIAAGFVVVGAISAHTALYWASVIFLVLFVVLVIIHRRLEKQLSRGQALADIYSRYLRRVDGTWRAERFLWPEGGMQTADPQEVDLDLYGPGSLYQYLCVAETYQGRAVLRELLRADPPEADEILRRQQAVEELWRKDSFRMEMLVALQELTSVPGIGDGEKAKAFIAEGENATKVSGTGVWLRRLMAWILPICTWACLLLSCIPAWGAPFFVPGVLLCVLQFILGLVGNTVFGNRLRAVFGFQRYLAAYQILFEQISKTEFTCAELRDKLDCIKEEALPAFHSLSRISGAVKIRFNPLGYLLSSLLLMWDFHCVDAWDRWKYRYGHHVSAWLQAVGTLEAMLSLLTLSETREQTVYPEVLSGETPEVHFTGLTHPLIPEAVAVGNDFSMESGLCVLTGSNMSGKTTFMRTLGVNLILMYAGGPVCAASLQASVMNIRTSMRISDHVGEGLSTFYAEVLRIRDIVEFVDEGKPVLVLIDEIYKGTNSKDRATCAVATAKRLRKAHTLVFMTTHDQELCKLSDLMADIQNYHFTERYEGDKLLFDYVILPGEATGSNAQHLLRLAGILFDK